MDNLRASTSWRHLLGQLIRDMGERKRIAAKAKVRPETLLRWANGTSMPHNENMQKLLAALPPTHIGAFARLIANEFPILAEEKEIYTRVQNELPSGFYEQILYAYARTPQPMCRQVIQDLVFQQAREHLDPERRGLSISLATFIRPLEGSKVRSMREIGGIGTPPWSGDLGQKTVFLGAESLVGYAIIRLSTLVVPNRVDPTFLPVHWTEYEQSVVVVPILQCGRVAGGLIVASAIPDYFTVGQPAVTIVECYARLATLLFEQEEFFEPENIALGFMPDYKLQVPYFQDFSRLVSQQFRLAQVRGDYVTLEQARRQVWREIEEALLQVFLGTAKLK